MSASLATQAAHARAEAEPFGTEKVALADEMRNAEVQRKCVEETRAPERARLTGETESPKLEIGRLRASQFALVSARTCTTAFLIDPSDPPRQAAEAVDEGAHDSPSWTGVAPGPQAADLESLKHATDAQKLFSSAKLMNLRQNIELIRANNRLVEIEHVPSPSGYHLPTIYTTYIHCP